MIGETVTLHRHTAGSVDDHGNPTASYTDVTVDNAAVSPRQGEEAGNNRDTVIAGLTVYLPAGVEVDPADQMTVRDVRYDVIGEPGVWTNPYTTAARGVQVALERVAG